MNTAFDFIKIISHISKRPTNLGQSQLPTMTHVCTLIIKPQ